MRESVVETKVCAHGAATGWLVRKIAYPGRRGAPDRHFYRRGVFLPIEFKAPGLKPEPHQLLEHARLAVAGFPVYVIDNIEDGIALLDSYD